jgi:hypothetical protein
MAASVLPIGPLTMWVGSDGSPSYVEPAMETELTRQRGFRVSKAGFRDGTLAHIAGVIFYPGSLFNSSTPSDEFFLVRNATASHQIPDGVLSFVTEWPNA